MVHQAIVLTGDSDAGARAPHLGRVAGLSMLERTLAMLQWAGVREAFVVVGPWDRGASQRSVTTPKILNPEKMQVRWVVDAGAGDRGGLSMAKLGRRVRGRVLVVRADTVYQRELVRDLVEQSPPVGGVVVATGAGGEEVGAMVLDHATVTAFNGHAVTEALSAFDREGRIRRRDVSDRFWVRVSDQNAVARAEDLLWDSCRKPVDGIVARHLNRHVSLFISRRIVGLPISPNQISVVTLVLGILAALLVSVGGYGWLLLGAAVFKLNSILDGVDGELARVRFQMSVVGEWMDTISDDVSNLLFFVALAMGAYRMTGSEGWITLGLLTAVPFLVATAYRYTLLLRSGRGDLLAIRWVFERGNGKGDGERSRFAALVDGIGLLLKKDFFCLLVLVMALASVLPWALVLTTVANLLLLGTIVAQELIFARMQRRGESVERVLSSQAGASTSSRAGGGTRTATAPAGR